MRTLVPPPLRKHEKYSKSIIVVIVIFSSVREIGCCGITFVAAVKICREHLFNKHAIETHPLKISLGTGELSLLVPSQCINTFDISI